MKKYSTRELVHIDGEQVTLDHGLDWGEDTLSLDDNRGLPYSGQAVQDYIKASIEEKYGKTDVEEEVKNQIDSTLFNTREVTERDSTGDKVLTSISGNSNQLTYTYKVKDPSGNITDRTNTIDISTVDVNAHYMTVTSNVDSAYINVGGNVNFYYGFNIQDYQGQTIANSYASVTLNLYRQGLLAPFYTSNLGQIAASDTSGSTTQTLSLTSILKLYATTSATIIATVSVAHLYEYIDGEETVIKTVNGQSSNTITVLDLQLSTSFSIGTAFSQGQLSIPYQVRGNGSKTITLYKNGVQADSVAGITSTSASGSFVQSIVSGNVNYQMVAQTTAGGQTVQSESYYFDVNVPVAGTSISLMYRDTTGLIQDTSNYEQPSFAATMYETFTMQYYVYNVASTTASLLIKVDELDSDNNVIVSNSNTLVVTRSVYTFSKRIKSSNKHRVTLQSGNRTRVFYIIPQIGSVNIELPTEGLLLNLDADGRSNEETNPAVWNYGEYSTTFTGVNFEEDGWTMDDGSVSLLLQNGATATINFPLFAAVNGTSPANNNGCTFEILLKVANVSTDTNPIVKCLWEKNSTQVGLNITSNYLGVNTGDSRMLPSDSGEERYEAVSVGQAYSAGTYYKYTFVVDKYSAGGQSCYKAYINGILSYAAQINAQNMLLNENNLPIVIDSTSCDVYIKSIKYYNVALTHNQCVNSTIADKAAVSEIEAMYNANDIYSEDAYGNQYISPKKIHDRGRGVMIFSPSVYQTTQHTLEDINDITDKKSKGYTMRIDYYAPEFMLRLDGSRGNGAPKGDAYNFTHIGCDVTILGTTSANRPRKNYRINFNKNQECTETYATNGYTRSDGAQKEAIKGKKGDAYKGDFFVNGVVNNKCKYSIDPGTVATARVCLKTDFVDSSMIHNTGGALVFNELTNAIEAAKNPALINTPSNNVRVAIDGFPIDVFMATDVVEGMKYTAAGELSDSNYVGLKYMGQYNFNNDKSKTGAMFGFDNWDNDCYSYDIATTTIDNVEHFDPVNTTGAYNSQGEGRGEAICLEFLNNTKPLNVFWTKFEGDNWGNAIVPESTFNGANFTDSLEMRAPSCLTDFISADNQGDFADTWEDVVGQDASIEYGGLDALYLDKQILATFEQEGGSDYKTDGVYTGDFLANYRWVSDCVKRPFKFIAECVKEVAQNNSVTVAQLNQIIDNNLGAILRANAFDSWDWTSTTFTSNAANYFNMTNVCMWYIWTDYLMAVDQRAKNMMFYTHDGLHWMFQYYDGDTILGETNDCALAYDYLTTRDTYDSARGQYAFQGHASWLWYLLRANFGSMLSSVCNTMRSTSNRFSNAYLKEIFDNQIVGNWNERLYNESQQYKYIDLLGLVSGQPGYNRKSSAYLNTVQGSRLAHRNYLIDNRFAMLDAYYQTDTWRSDNMTFNLTGSTGSIEITSVIPYTFGCGKASRAIDETQSTSADNNYRITLSPTGGSANEPVMIYGASRILTFTASGPLLSTNEANPAIFSSLVLEKLDLSGITNGTYIGLSGTTSLKEIDIHGSSISTISGLLNCKKLRKFDALNTDFTNFQVADGCPIQTIKLNAPQTIILSNNNNVVYQNSTGDTLTVTNWNNLLNLVLNNCSNVNDDEILTKFFNSSATNKAIRYENIDRTISSIEWLDQFDGMNGLVKTAVGDYTVSTGGPVLIGTVVLADYTDDDVVDEYRARFTDLTIKQPEFTMICCKDVAADASISNMDNSTGFYFGNAYVPSGHVQNILSRVHRYLGKVSRQGSRVDLVGNHNDADPYGQSFKGREADGVMTLIQLADEDSRYYNTGYRYAATRQLANISGTSGNGEVGVYIPGFWYKGINHYCPSSSNDDQGKFNFTCFSSLVEKPSVSEDIKYYTVSQLDQSQALSENDTDGWYRLNALIQNSLSGTQFLTADTRIINRPNGNVNVYRIKVQGYKKIQYPASIAGYSIFTDTSGNVLLSTNQLGDPVVKDGVGQVSNGAASFVYNGLPIILNIPSSAVYMFITVKTDMAQVGSTNTVSCDHCKIVLHRGSKFESATDMTIANAKEWLADMEPDWVYSDPVWIGAAECRIDSTSGGDTLYTPFDNLYTATVGDGTTAAGLDPYGYTYMNLYYFRHLAEKRGMQLIDYEASKLIAMLFFAKYGVKDSQKQLGGGMQSTTRKLGATASIGMQDTNRAVTQYNAIGSNNFLGIENVSGNVYEWLDRTYFSNETAEDCGKMRITMPDLSTRRVYSVIPSGNYPTAVAHGKYCDIISCSTTAGSSTTGYADFQTTFATRCTNFISSHAVSRSGSNASADGGVSYLNGSNSVANSYTIYGSRLIFRGAFNITDNISNFENTIDDRTLAD